jgi:Spermine/spermidine synthase domain
MSGATSKHYEEAAHPLPRRWLGDRAQLVVRSFLMLFLELALIRWSGSNVLYLSHFSNFVLLGSFLGIGLGFLRAGARRDLSAWAPVAVAVLVAFVWFSPLEIDLKGSGNFIFIGGDPELSGAPREVVLPVIFVLVAATMAVVGEGVARAFSRFEPLEAYKLDLLGSVLGIIGFAGMSFLRVPPLGWGLVVAAVFVAISLPLPDRRAAVALLPLLPFLAVLGWESTRPDTYWSPYYKIRAEAMASDGTLISVNRIPHQAHQPVTRTSGSPGIAGGPGVFAYEMVKPPVLDDVLIVGAGGGNDVAAALLKGAGHVDAVEIDPQLYELGKARHPNAPYDDPRVSVHIDDGRAFLERTNRRYDLILFALPDSLTLVSGQSSLRLESFLFTDEALTTAREHLEPGGVFSMYNYYREDWLADRFARTLGEVYEAPPCQMSLGSGEARFSLLAASERSSSLDCSATSAQDGPEPHIWRQTSNSVPGPATDDHPFPYLRTRRLTSFYVTTIALILLASLAMVRLAAGPFRKMAPYVDLFFMGAAFLLLETKGVVQFALLFGTTWFVNALVFLGVLLSVLAAVAVSKRVVVRRPARLYGVLLVSLVLAWVVPLDELLDLPVGVRFVVAVTLAFFPIFTANLVFTQRFRDTASSTTAFGANLLGAMVGGLLEYGALIVGYRALLVVAAVLYGLAFLAGRRHLTPEAVIA